jgi:hypothetical protein
VPTFREVKPVKSGGINISTENQYTIKNALSFGRDFLSGKKSPVGSNPTSRAL